MTKPTAYFIESAAARAWTRRRWQTAPRRRHRRCQPDRLDTAAAAGPPPSWRQGANAAVYRSDDGGEHWRRLEHGLPVQFDAMVRHMVMDEADTLYIAAGHDLFVSQDEGDSWRWLTGELPTIHALAVI
ncbi:MAG TPA: hypothetical protein VNP04_28335 [Alphaproteobacteria bacterium]|nr:hypothetical protein [Alphaproteobacteria bacterium]